MHQHGVRFTHLCVCTCVGLHVVYSIWLSDANTCQLLDCKPLLATNDEEVQDVHRVAFVWFMWHVPPACVAILP